MPKNNKIKYVIPRTVADSIPYECVYRDGIIKLKENEYSKTYEIPDVNFKIADDNTQVQITEMYMQFLDALPEDCRVEVSILNETVDIEEFKEKAFLKERYDDLSEYRDEYNKMLAGKMALSKNNISSRRFFTVTVKAIDKDEAEDKFKTIDSSVITTFNLITKEVITAQDTEERLDILNKIYNGDFATSLFNKRMIAGKEVEAFNIDNLKLQGITTKDAIAPSSFTFKSGYGMIGDIYFKSFTVSAYPTWIKGGILSDFATLPFNMLTSLHLEPISREDGIKMIRNRNKDIDAEMSEAQQKAIRAGHGIISRKLTRAQEEAEKILESMQKENTKLYLSNFIFTIFAKTQEELTKYARALRQTASGHLLTIKSLDYQQEDAFNSSLPIGCLNISNQRLMLSNTVAILNPFGVKDIFEAGGFYYGVNPVSHSLILCNRLSDKYLTNSNACILGMPGAGKSFAAKREMINVLLNTDDDLYVIDPEREYLAMARELSGTDVRLSNSGNIYINPFDINLDNVDDEGGDAVKVKSSFIEAICDIMIGGKLGLSPEEKSLIGRCVDNIYEPHVKYLRENNLSQDRETAPTFIEFYDELKKQPEPDAHRLALALEKYVKGSLDIFSHRTNVDVDNRFVIYDIKSISSGVMQELALQISLDNIWNKMLENAAKGKKTFMYIDEFHVLMKNKTSAEYISQIWKRARKWGGIPCAITQNVEDMLKSEDARTVINNSPFIILLGQSSLNRMDLANLFAMSTEEQRYISSAKPGMGLIILHNVTNIPFDDTFPKDTKLYKIMSTKPDERTYE